MSISNFCGTRTFDSAMKTINNVRICTSWSRHVNFIFNLGALKFPMQCYIISHTNAVSVLPSSDYSMSLAIASELPTWRNVSPFIFVGQRLNLKFVYISLFIKRQLTLFPFYIPRQIPFLQVCLHIEARESASIIQVLSQQTWWKGFHHLARCQTDCKWHAFYLLGRN